MTEQQRQLVKAYKDCFATEAGQAVLAHLYSQHFKDAQTFVPGSDDGNAYNAGRREVVLRIQRQVEMDLEAKQQTTAITEEKENE